MVQRRKEKILNHKILGNSTMDMHVVETLLLPTDAHNVKKHRVIKTF